MTISLKVRVRKWQFARWAVRGWAVRRLAVQVLFEGAGVLLRAGDEEDGDVVASAVGVGSFDEGLAGGFEGGGGGVEDRGDFGVGEFAGEAVGGEEEEVAGVDGVGDDVGLDGGEGPDGAGDDVANG